MGVNILHKYRAVVDYYRHSLTFNVAGERLKVRLEFQ